MRPRRPIDLRPALALLMGLALLLPGCRERFHRPLRVGLLIWPPYEVFYLARHLGYLDPARIDLVDYNSNTDVIEDFRTGVIDAVCVTADHYVDSLRADPEVRIVLVVDQSNGGDAILAKPRYESLAALKGARIGMTPSSLGAFFVTRALDQAGLRLGDVTPVYLEESEQERAFAEDQIDAVAVFEPVRTRLLSGGARLLFDSSSIPGEITDVLMVRSETIESRAGELQSLVDGFFRAREELLRDPESAARIVAPRERITPREFIAALRGVDLPDRAENLRLLETEPEAMHATLRSVGRVMVRIGAIPAEPDLGRALDGRFVRESGP